MSFPPIKILDGGYNEAVKAGFTGHNTLLGIKIFRDIHHFVPILAQERYEWGFRWKVVLAVTVIAAALIALVANDPVLLAAALPIGIFSTMLPVFKRRLEYVGQAVEAVVAARYYDADLENEYELAIKQLATSYSQFNGMDIADIRKGFLKCAPIAHKWVDGNSGFIHKWMKK